MATVATTSENCIYARLSDRWEWFADTPIVLELEHGRVVSSRRPAN